MIGMDAMGISRSGIVAATRMLDASANNLANVATTKPIESAAFQGGNVVLTERKRGGVAVLDVVPAGTEEGVPVESPGDPRGPVVRMPDLDVAGQMVNMVTAQRMVEANVTTIQRASEAYRSLLDITDRRRDLSHDPYA
jgi:flagellar basal-body rod protein FlgC